MTDAQAVAHVERGVLNWIDGRQFNDKKEVLLYAALATEAAGKGEV